MPAEWVAHTRTWMGWPHDAETWGGEGFLRAAQDAYLLAAATIARYEPVSLVVPPKQAAGLPAMADDNIQVFEGAFNDAWLRDIGPTFVCGPSGLAAVDWRFNAWGGNYADFAADAALAGGILDALGIAAYQAPLVMEGGSFHVDGEGTLLTTEQCLLNPNRNPTLNREEIETHLRDYLNVETVLWLGDGLVDDETDGHVDNLACFVRPGVVAALSCEDPQDPNYAPLKDNIERLKIARDARGRRLQVIEIEQPSPQFSANGERLALSYINFYIANGVIVMPAFGDAESDAAARQVLTKAFPDRGVEQIPVLDIIAGGGGLHCITQQQPACGST